MSPKRWGLHLWITWVFNTFELLKKSNQFCFSFSLCSSISYKRAKMCSTPLMPGSSLVFPTAVVHKSQTWFSNTNKIDTGVYNSNLKHILIYNSFLTFWLVYFLCCDINTYTAVAIPCTCSYSCNLIQADAPGTHKLPEVHTSHNTNISYQIPPTLLTGSGNRLLYI